MASSISDQKFISLTNDFFSYVMRITDSGQLEHVYYGPTITVSEDLDLDPRVERALCSVYEGLKNENLNELSMEYPCFGRSDYREPTLKGRNKDGNSIFSFEYHSHEILEDKPTIRGLPSARGGMSQTLKLVMVDKYLQLELQLFYTIYDKHAVLTKSSKLVNRSDHKIILEKIASSSLEFPAGDYDVLHLHGTWSRELNTERLPLARGRFVIDSKRGSSSAAHNPFVAVLESDASEDHGKVFATALMYSGNFEISLEKGEYESIRVVTGINPHDFSWHLEAGGQLDTPEVIHVFSSNGLRQMSHTWQSFIVEKVSPLRFKDKVRPSYLNTWEACYFDVSSEKVLHLADRAVELGLDMLVLDDGWFGKRNDDTTSLGDWESDRDKFPEGIAALAKMVKAKGLKFGLWFEPEMINPSSELYRQHPEWVIQVPGRKASLGRNQLTLDLSQVAVVEHIFSLMDKHLSSCEIDYVKWDMNRNFTELGSTSLAAERQGELGHRYILGLYELISRLTEKHPEVLFENCASGGNRMDLGMLSYFPQTWTSDMCDPIGRLEIIHGASYLFPMDVLAAYIGPSPNHQNGRVTSLDSRFLAGFFCGARGISLNEADIDANLEDLKTYIQKIKSTQQEMLGGRFDRLLKRDNRVSWQFTTRDQSKVYVLCFQILSATNLPITRVRLVGLEKKRKYRLLSEDKTYGGDTLMHMGLTFPHVSAWNKTSSIRRMDGRDFTAYLFELNRI